MSEGTEKATESTPESATPVATETTCRRELELEIPADEVSKAMERVAKEFAKVARVPGFRPGKAPITLIRRRFAKKWPTISMIGGQVASSRAWCYAHAGQ